MNTITKIVVLASLCLIMGQTQAQDSTKLKSNHFRIERLQQQRKTVSEEEKALLKVEVERINDRLEKGEITHAQAETLKLEKAKKRALNIENRMAILDNEIALLERNDASYKLGDDNKK